MEEKKEPKKWGLKDYIFAPIALCILIGIAVAIISGFLGTACWVLWPCLVLIIKIAIALFENLMGKIFLLMFTPVILFELFHLTVIIRRWVGLEDIEVEPKSGWTKFWHWSVTLMLILGATLGNIWLLDTYGPNSAPYIYVAELTAIMSSIIAIETDQKMLLIPLQGLGVVLSGWWMTIATSAVNTFLERYPIQVWTAKSMPQPLLYFICGAVTFAISGGILKFFPPRKTIRILYRWLSTE